MNKIGLFFGSFNPIHNGHIEIARTVLEQGKLQHIEFVVSPQNPFKKQQELLPEKSRLELVTEVLENEPQMLVNTIEFQLNQPNYTAETLQVLHKNNPTISYVLIMGADNYSQIRKWKNYQAILEYPIYIYPRVGIEIPYLCKNRFLVKAPLLDISASEIRNKVRNKQSLKKWVHPFVASYLLGTNDI